MKHRNSQRREALRLFVLLPALSLALLPAGLWLIFQAQAQEGTILYVRTDGVSSGNCDSWTNACRLRPPCPRRSLVLKFG